MLFLLSIPYKEGITLMSLRRFIKCINRIICTVLLVCFSLNTVVYGSVPISANPSVFSSLFQSKSLFHIELPNSLGVVEEQKQLTPVISSDHPFLIHIQDAHANPTAQRNIQQTINYLVKEYDINTVFIEGAQGVLNKQNIEFIPDAHSNQQFVQQLVELGEATGAEMALLNPEHKNKVQFVGIENIQSYQKNFLLFQKVMSQWEESNQWIEQQRKTLDQSATKILDKTALKILRHSLKADHQNINQVLSDLDKATQEKLARNLHSPLEQFSFPNLVRLYMLKEEAGQIDVEKAKQEWSKLGKWIFDTPSGVSKMRVPNVVEQILFGNSQQTLRPLLEQLISQDVNFQDYPHLAQLARNKIFQQEIQSKDLFKEIEHLTQLILNKSAVRDDQKQLIAEAKQFRLISKLITLQLTREEWSVIASEAWQSQAFKLRTPSKKTLAGRQNLELRTAISFYKTAIDRDEVFIQNIKQYIEQHKQTKAIVITGGFHTEGLKQRFNRDSTSYAVIRPHLGSEINTNFYREIMTRDTQTSHLMKALLAGGEDTVTQLMTPKFYKPRRVFVNNRLQEFERSHFGVRSPQSAPRAFASSLGLANKWVVSDNLTIQFDPKELVDSFSYDELRGLFRDGIDAMLSYPKKVRPGTSPQNEAQKVNFESEPGAIIHLTEGKNVLPIGDLQGHYHNFIEILMHPKVMSGLQDGTLHLLFLGDLIHPSGSLMTQDDGQLQSLATLILFMQIKKEFPRNVHTILGNHELAHIKGSHYSSTKKDVDNKPHVQDREFEKFLESRFNFKPAKQIFADMDEFFRAWPLMARIKVGGEYLMALHARPPMSVEFAEKVSDVARILTSSEGQLSEVDLELLDFENLDQLANILLFGGYDFKINPYFATLLNNREFNLKKLHVFLSIMGLAGILTGHTVPIPQYAKTRGFKLFGTKDGAYKLRMGHLDNNLLLDASTPLNGPQKHIASLMIGMEQKLPRKFDNGPIDWPQINDSMGSPAIQLIGLDAARTLQLRRQVGKIFGQSRKGKVKVTKELKQLLILLRGSLNRKDLARHPLMAHSEKEIRRYETTAKTVSSNYIKQLRDVIGFGLVWKKGDWILEPNSINAASLGKDKRRRNGETEKWSKNKTFVIASEARQSLNFSASSLGHHSVIPITDKFSLYLDPKELVGEYTDFKKLKGLFEQSAKEMKYASEPNSVLHRPLAANSEPGALLNINEGDLILTVGDLQGHYHRLVALLLEPRVLAGLKQGTLQLAFLGDLIHPAGPLMLEEDSQLQSLAVLILFAQLKEAFPNQVHTILGNHEMTHIQDSEMNAMKRDDTGRPHFQNDEFEEYLDETYEAQSKDSILLLMNRFFRSWPLMIKVKLQEQEIMLLHARPPVDLYWWEVDKKIFSDTIEKLINMVAGELGYAYKDNPDLKQIVSSRKYKGEVLEAFLNHFGLAGLISGHTPVGEKYAKQFKFRLLQTFGARFGLFENNLILDASHHNDFGYSLLTMKKPISEKDAVFEWEEAEDDIGQPAFKIIELNRVEGLNLLWGKAFGVAKNDNLVTTPELREAIKLIRGRNTMLTLSQLMGGAYSVDQIIEFENRALYIPTDYLVHLRNIIGIGPQEIGGQWYFEVSPPKQADGSISAASLGEDRSGEKENWRADTLRNRLGTWISDTVALETVSEMRVPQHKSQNRGAISASSLGKENESLFKMGSLPKDDKNYIVWLRERIKPRGVSAKTQEKMVKRLVLAKREVVEEWVEEGWIKVEAGEALLARVLLANPKEIEQAIEGWVKFYKEEDVKGKNIELAVGLLISPKRYELAKEILGESKESLIKKIKRTYGNKKLFLIKDVLKHENQYGRRIFNTAQATSIAISRDAKAAEEAALRVIGLKEGGEKIFNASQATQIATSRDAKAAEEAALRVIGLKEGDERIFNASQATKIATSRDAKAAEKIALDILRLVDKNGEKIFLVTQAILIASSNNPKKLLRAAQKEIKEGRSSWSVIMREVDIDEVLKKEIASEKLSERFKEALEVRKLVEQGDQDDNSAAQASSMGRDRDRDRNGEERGERRERTVIARQKIKEPWQSQDRGAVLASSLGEESFELPPSHGLVVTDQLNLIFNSKDLVASLNIKQLIKLFEKATASMAYEKAKKVTRWKDSRGKPGALLNIRKGSNVLTVGDLQGRYENLISLLLDQGVLSGLKDGSLHLVFVGDLIHPQSFAILNEDAQEQSLATLILFMQLRIAFPEQVHTVLGNHEASHLKFNGRKLKAFKKDNKEDVHDQAVEFEDYLRGLSKTKKTAEHLVDVLRKFLTTWPLMVRFKAWGEHLLVLHARPPMEGLFYSYPTTLNQLTNLLHPYFFVPGHFLEFLGEESPLLGMLISRDYNLKRLRKFLSAVGVAGIISGHSPTLRAFAKKYKFQSLRKERFGKVGNNLILDASVFSNFGYAMIGMNQELPRDKQGNIKWHQVKDAYGNLAMRKVVGGKAKYFGFLIGKNLSVTEAGFVVNGLPLRMVLKFSRGLYSKAALARHPAIHFSAAQIARFETKAKKVPVEYLRQLRDAIGYGLVEVNREWIFEPNSESLQASSLGKDRDGPTYRQGTGESAIRTPQSAQRAPASSLGEESSELLDSYGLTVSDDFNLIFNPEDLVSSLDLKQLKSLFRKATKSMAYKRTKKVTRPKDSKGKPGALLNIQKGSNVVTVGDIQGRYDNFVALLLEPGILSGLKDGSLHLAFVGDLIHPQSAQILEEGAQEESFAVLMLFMQLRVAFPEQVHSVLGNHEAAQLSFLDWSFTVTKKDTKKKVHDQGQEFEDYVETLADDRRGKEILVDLLQEFLESWPLMIRFKAGDESLMVFHARPPVDVKKLERLRDKPAMQGPRFDTPTSLNQLANLLYFHPNFQGAVLGNESPLRSLILSRVYDMGLLNEFLNAVGIAGVISGHTIPSSYWAKVLKFQSFRRASFGKLGNNLIIDASILSDFGYAMIGMNQELPKDKQGDIDWNRVMDGYGNLALRNATLADRAKYFGLLIGKSGGDTEQGYVTSDDSLPSVLQFIRGSYSRMSLSRHPAMHFSPSQIARFETKAKKVPVEYLRQLRDAIGYGLVEVNREWIFEPNSESLQASSLGEDRNGPVYPAYRQAGGKVGSSKKWTVPTLPTGRQAARQGMGEIAVRTPQSAQRAFSLGSSSVIPITDRFSIHLDPQALVDRYKDFKNLEVLFEQSMQAMRYSTDAGSALHRPLVPETNQPGALLNINQGELLLPVGDLQGHYHRLVALLLEPRVLTGLRNGTLHLAFLGDLIHPSGKLMYQDDAQMQSFATLILFSQLKVAFPNQVHTVLGNHELSHITESELQLYKNHAGGKPQYQNFKFHMYLSEIYSGKDVSTGELLDDYFRFWPLMINVAVGPQRIMLLHARPPVDLDWFKKLGELLFNTAEHFVGLVSGKKEESSYKFKNNSELFEIQLSRKYNRDVLNAFLEARGLVGIISGHTPLKEDTEETYGIEFPFGLGNRFGAFHNNLILDASQRSDFGYALLNMKRGLTDENGDIVWDMLVDDNQEMAFKQVYVERFKKLKTLLGASYGKSVEGSLTSSNELRKALVLVRGSLTRKTISKLIKAPYSQSQIYQFEKTALSIPIDYLVQLRNVIGVGLREIDGQWYFEIKEDSTNAASLGTVPSGLSLNGTNQQSLERSNLAIRTPQSAQRVLASSLGLNINAASKEDLIQFFGVAYEETRIKASPEDVNRVADRVISARPINSLDDLALLQGVMPLISWLAYYASTGNLTFGNLGIVPKRGLSPNTAEGSKAHTDRAPPEGGTAAKIDSSTLHSLFRSSSAHPDSELPMRIFLETAGLSIPSSTSSKISLTSKYSLLPVSVSQAKRKLFAEVFIPTLSESDKSILFSKPIFLLMKGNQAVGLFIYGVPYSKTVREQILPHINGEYDSALNTFKSFLLGIRLTRKPLSDEEQVLHRMVEYSQRMLGNPIPQIPVFVSPPSEWRNTEIRFINKGEGFARTTLGLTTPLKKSTVVFPKVYPIVSGTGQVHLQSVERLFTAKKPVVKTGGKVLIVGSGAGPDALIAALNGAEVYVVEINPLAAANTRLNARLYGVSERVHVIESDIFDDSNTEVEEILNMENLTIIWHMPTEFNEESKRELEFATEGATNQAFDVRDIFKRLVNDLVPRVRMDARFVLTIYRSPENFMTLIKGGLGVDQIITNHYNSYDTYQNTRGVRELQETMWPFSTVVFSKKEKKRLEKERVKDFIQFWDEAAEAIHFVKIDRTIIPLSNERIKALIERSQRYFREHKDGFLLSPSEEIGLTKAETVLLRVFLMRLVWLQEQARELLADGFDHWKEVYQDGGLIHQVGVNSWIFESLFGYPKIEVTGLVLNDFRTLPQNRAHRLLRLREFHEKLKNPGDTLTIHGYSPKFSIEHESYEGALFWYEFLADLETVGFTILNKSTYRETQKDERTRVVEDSYKQQAFQIIAMRTDAASLGTVPSGLSPNGTNQQSLERSNLAIRTPKSAQRAFASSLGEDRNGPAYQQAGSSKKWTVPTGRQGTGESEIRTPQFAQRAFASSLGALPIMEDIFSSVSPMRIFLESVGFELPTDRSLISGSGIETLDIKLSQDPKFRKVFEEVFFPLESSDQFALAFQNGKPIALVLKSARKNMKLIKDNIPAMPSQSFQQFVKGNNRRPWYLAINLSESNKRNYARFADQLVTHLNAENGFLFDMYQVQSRYLLPISWRSPIKKVFLEDGDKNVFGLNTEFPESFLYRFASVYGFRTTTGATHNPSVEDVIKPGDEVLVIGGGIGVDPIIAALKGAKVTVVEVNPVAAKNIELNAKLHGVSDQIEVITDDIFNAENEKISALLEKDNLIVVWHMPTSSFGTPSDKVQGLTQRSLSVRGLSQQFFEQFVSRAKNGTQFLLSLYLTPENMIRVFRANLRIDSIHHSMTSLNGTFPYASLLMQKEESRIGDSDFDRMLDLWSLFLSSENIVAALMILVQRELPEIIFRKIIVMKMLFDAGIPKQLLLNTGEKVVTLAELLILRHWALRFYEMSNSRRDFSFFGFEPLRAAHNDDETRGFMTAQITEDSDLYFPEVQTFSDGEEQFQRITIPDFLSLPKNFEERTQFFNTVFSRLHRPNALFILNGYFENYSIEPFGFIREDGSVMTSWQEFTEELKQVDFYILTADRMHGMDGNLSRQAFRIVALKETAQASSMGERSSALSRQFSAKTKKGLGKWIFDIPSGVSKMRVPTQPFSASSLGAINPVIFVPNQTFRLLKPLFEPLSVFGERFLDKHWISRSFVRAVTEFTKEEEGEVFMRALEQTLGREVSREEIKGVTAGFYSPIVGNSLDANYFKQMLMNNTVSAVFQVTLQRFDEEDQIVDFFYDINLSNLLAEVQPKISDDDLANPLYHQDSGIILGQHYSFISAPVVFENGSVARFGIDLKSRTVRLVNIKGYNQNGYDAIDLTNQFVDRAKALFWTPFWQKLFSELPEEGDVLNLGIGRGRGLVWSGGSNESTNKLPAEWINRMVGFDFILSPALAERYPNLRLVKGDWTKLQFEPEAFSLAFGLNTITAMGLEDIDPVLKGLDASIRPNSEGIKRMVFVSDEPPRPVKFFGGAEDGGHGWNSVNFLDVWKEIITEKFEALGYTVNFRFEMTSFTGPKTDFQKRWNEQSQLDSNFYRYTLNEETRYDLNDPNLSPGETKEEYEVLIIEATKVEASSLGKDRNGDREKWTVPTLPTGRQAARQGTGESAIRTPQSAQRAFASSLGFNINAATKEKLSEFFDAAYRELGNPTLEVTTDFLAEKVLSARPLTSLNDLARLQGFRIAGQLMSWLYLKTEQGDLVFDSVQEEEPLALAETVVSAFNTDNPRGFKIKDKKGANYYLKAEVIPGKVYQIDGMEIKYLEASNHDSFMIRLFNSGGSQVGRYFANVYRGDEDVRVINGFSSILDSRIRATGITSEVFSRLGQFLPEGTVILGKPSNTASLVVLAKALPEPYSNFPQLKEVLMQYEEMVTLPPSRKKEMSSAFIMLAADQAITPMIVQALNSGFRFDQKVVHQTPLAKINSKAGLTNHEVLVRGGDDLELISWDPRGSGERTMQMIRSMMTDASSLGKDRNGEDRAYRHVGRKEKREIGVPSPESGVQASSLGTKSKNHLFKSVITKESQNYIAWLRERIKPKGVSAETQERIVNRLVRAKREVVEEWVEEGWVKVEVGEALLGRVSLTNPKEIAEAIEGWFGFYQNEGLKEKDIELAVGLLIGPRRYKLAEEIMGENKGVLIRKIKQVYGKKKLLFIKTLLEREDEDGNRIFNVAQATQIAVSRDAKAAEEAAVKVVKLEVDGERIFNAAQATRIARSKDAKAAEEAAVKVVKLEVDGERIFNASQATRIAISRDAKAAEEAAVKVVKLEVDGERIFNASQATQIATSKDAKAAEEAALKIVKLEVDGERIFNAAQATQIAISRDAKAAEESAVKVVKLEVDGNRIFNAAQATRIARSKDGKSAEKMAIKILKMEDKNRQKIFSISQAVRIATSSKPEGLLKASLKEIKSGRSASPIIMRAVDPDEILDESAVAEIVAVTAVSDGEISVKLQQALELKGRYEWDGTDEGQNDEDGIQASSLGSDRNGGTENWGMGERTFIQAKILGVQVTRLVFDRAAIELWPELGRFVRMGGKSLGDEALVEIPEAVYELLDETWGAMNNSDPKHYETLLKELEEKYGFKVVQRVGEYPFVEQLDEFLVEMVSFLEWVQTRIQSGSSIAEIKRADWAPALQMGLGRFYDDLERKFNKPESFQAYVDLARKLYVEDRASLTFDFFDASKGDVLGVSRVEEITTILHQSVLTFRGIFGEAFQDLLRDDRVNPGLTFFVSQLRSDDLLEHVASFRDAITELRHQMIRLSYPNELIDHTSYETIDHLVGNFYQHVTRKKGRWGVVLLSQTLLDGNDYVVVSLDNGPGIKNIQGAVEGSSFSRSGNNHEGVKRMTEASRDFIIRSKGKKLRLQYGEPLSDEVDPKSNGVAGTQMIIINPSSEQDLWTQEFRGSSLGDELQREFGVELSMNEKQPLSTVVTKVFLDQSEKQQRVLIDSLNQGDEIVLAVADDVKRAEMEELEEQLTLLARDKNITVVTKRLKQLNNYLKHKTGFGLEQVGSEAILDLEDSIFSQFLLEVGVLDNQDLHQIYSIISSLATINVADRTKAYRWLGLTPQGDRWLIGLNVVATLRALEAKINNQQRLDVAA